jgi:hypothetical protein
MVLCRNQELCGKIVAETSDGEHPFLVIRVPELGEALIVPAGKTQPALSCEATK